MRYTILSLLIFGLFGTSTQAQNIPDANFANAIRTQCPTCIDANNDLLPAATTQITLDVSSQNISNLQGVQGFIGLDSLICASNNLTALPTLPANLTYFKCSRNQITSLPALPSNLRTLWCDHNRLTGLPALPSTLEVLFCEYNPSILVLPTLPAGLTGLYCTNTGLSNLPTSLPSGLIYLYCEYNSIANLPALPNTLKQLFCYRNNISSLPTLPNSLEALYTGWNPLTTLPALPALLQSLDCQHSQVTALPAFPNSLREIYCHHNFLTSIPTLPPYLWTLNASFNTGLTCIPILPNTMSSLSVNSTSVYCIPNIPAGIAASNITPICALFNNPNNCDAYAGVSGRVFIDYDNDCVYNVANDSNVVAGLVVRVIDSQNNDFFTYTNAQGYYAVNLPLGVYTIQVEAAPAYLYSNCTSTQFSITASGASASIQQDLGLQPLLLCAVLETNIDANLLRRCMTGTYGVNYRNVGTLAAQNAYIDIEFDSYLSYVSNTANISATALGNNVYRFPIGDLNVSQIGNFQAVVSVSCNAAFGQVHCTNAQIFPNTPCGVNWNGAIISILDTCMVDSVVFRLVNSGSNMLASQTYSIVEDNLMYRPITAFQLNAGGTLDIAIPTRPNRTYRIEVQQAPNYPALLGDSLAWAIVQNCNGISNTTASNPNIFNTCNIALAVSTDCTPNRGAYDPNQKTAQQIGYGSQHFILANTPLEYKIEFQNTGTDTAFRVVILDTLDTNVLDPASIQIGTSSHTFTWALLQNNILKFTFDNILLVDSFANEPLSHGYVTFNIAQQPNLAVNTVINNKAAIYFDFNSPIITNTCFHTIGTNFVPRVAVSVGEVLNKNISVKAYPNPFQTESILEVVGAENQVLTLKIVDAMGKTVQSQTSNQSTLRISRENLPTGLYFYQLFGDGQLLNTGKLIAE